MPTKGLLKGKSKIPIDLLVFIDFKMVWKTFEYACL